MPGKTPETRYEVAVIGGATLSLPIFRRSAALSPLANLDLRAPLLPSGGPAGLVALKTLKESGLHAVLFEAEDGIGGTFRSVTVIARGTHRLGQS
jgi:hypothetical protein